MMHATYQVHPPSNWGGGQCILHMGDTAVIGEGVRLFFFGGWNITMPRDSYVTFL